MKKTFLILAMGSVLASCGSSNEQSAIQATKTADSLQGELARQRTIDSMSQAAGQPQQQPASADVPASTQVITVDRHTEYRHHEEHGDGRPDNGAERGPDVPNNAAVPVTTNATTTTNVTTTSTTTAPPAKKGWSAKADGALIGAGAGAVTGALIDSKKKGQAVKGGVIGGVIGAAAGLGAGAIIDKEKKDKQDKQNAADNSDGK